LYDLGSMLPSNQKSADESSEWTHHSRTSAAAALGGVIHRSKFIHRLMFVRACGRHRHRHLGRAPIQGVRRDPDRHNARHRHQRVLLKRPHCGPLHHARRFRLAARRGPCEDPHRITGLVVVGVNPFSVMSAGKGSQFFCCTFADHHHTNRDSSSEGLGDHSAAGQRTPYRHTVPTSEQCISRETARSGA
jgi:hypothetical protein